MDGISSDLEEPAEGDEEEEEDEAGTGPYEVQEGSPHTPDQEQFLKQHFETLANGAAPGVVRLVIAILPSFLLAQQRGRVQRQAMPGGFLGEAESGARACFKSWFLSPWQGAQSGCQSGQSLGASLHDSCCKCRAPHSGTLPTAACFPTRSPSSPDLVVLPVGPVLPQGGLSPLLSKAQSSLPSSTAPSSFVLADLVPALLSQRPSVL